MLSELASNRYWVLTRKVSFFAEVIAKEERNTAKQTAAAELQDTLSLLPGRKLERRGQVVHGSATACKTLAKFGFACLF